MKLRDTLKGVIYFLCKAFNIVNNYYYNIKVLLLKRAIKKIKIKSLNNSEIFQFLDKIFIQI